MDNIARKRKHEEEELKSEERHLDELWDHRDFVDEDEDDSYEVIDED